MDCQYELIVTPNSHDLLKSHQNPEAGLKAEISSDLQEGLKIIVLLVFTHTNM